MRRSICAFSLLSISFTLISDRPTGLQVMLGCRERERWRWERACGHQVSRLVIVLEANSSSFPFTLKHACVITSLSVDINLERFCRFAPSSSNHVGKIYPFLERYYFFILFRRWCFLNVLFSHFRRSVDNCLPWKFWPRRNMLWWVPIHGPEKARVDNWLIAIGAYICDSFNLLSTKYKHMRHYELTCI